MQELLTNNLKHSKASLPGETCLLTPSDSLVLRLLRLFKKHLLRSYINLYIKSSYQI